jgi:peptide/nickel transport system substrate-binding protein/oligopeptide transport system substrate-binding protein
MHTLRRKLSIPGLLVLIGTLALLLSACGTSGNASGQGDKAKDQTLKLIWPSGGGVDIPTLDPGQVSDNASGPVVSAVFDGLVTLDKNLNVELWGAQKIDVSPDGLTYTFHLRPNQKFSDGTPVKASDYAYAMDRSVNPCLGSQVASYLSPLKDASTFIGETCTKGAISGSIQTLVGDSIIPDDSANTLTAKLEAPAGYFLDAMTYATSYALDKKVVQGASLGQDDKWLDNLAQGATGQGGSGMFYVSTWDHAGNLILKPNPNWWGVSAGKKPNFTEIDFKIFDSGDTAYNTYLSDQSYANSNIVPVGQVAAAKSQPDFIESPALIVGGLEFNWKITPFDNLDARKAFCLALNRDQLNQSISKGTVTPSWHIVPKGMPGYNPSLLGIDGAGTTGDLAKAQQHWNAYKATLNGAPVPPIKLSFNLSFASQKAAAEAYQATWNQAFGANIQIDQTAWATILAEEHQKKVQLYRFGWGADYPDPQDFLTLLFSTNSVINDSNASLPAADQLMTQADQISDPAKQAERLKLYNQAEQMLIDQVAYCPLSQAKNQYRQRTWVKGDFIWDAQGTWPNDAFTTGYIANH